MRTIKTVLAVASTFFLGAIAAAVKAQTAASGSNSLGLSDVPDFDLACSCADPRLALKTMLQIGACFILVPIAAVFLARSFAKRQDPVRRRRSIRVASILVVSALVLLALAFGFAYLTLQDDPELFSCCSSGGWWF